MSPAEIIASAEVALFPAYQAEARRQTDDGRIWPFSRAAMRNGQAIRERIAEDLRALLRARGAGAVITTEDYLLLGWRRQQAEQHGLAAVRLLNPENSCGADLLHEAEDRARDLANEVA